MVSRGDRIRTRRCVGWRCARPRSAGPAWRNVVDGLLDSGAARAARSAARRCGRAAPNHACEAVAQGFVRQRHGRSRWSRSISSMRVRPGRRRPSPHSSARSPTAPSSTPRAAGIARRTRWSRWRRQRPLERRRAGSLHATSSIWQVRIVRRARRDHARRSRGAANARRRSGRSRGQRGARRARRAAAAARTTARTRCCHSRPRPISDGWRRRAPASRFATSGSSRWRFSPTRRRPRCCGSCGWRSRATTTA